MVNKKKEKSVVLEILYVYWFVLDNNIRFLSNSSKIDYEVVSGMVISLIYILFLTAYLFRIFIQQKRYGSTEIVKLLGLAFVLVIVDIILVIIFTMKGFTLG